MKYLILIVFIFIGCKSVVDPDPREDIFDPYMIGTWKFTTANTATWIGHANKTDTITYNFPDSIHLSLSRHWKDEDHVILEVLDSTLNTNSYDSRWAVNLNIDLPYDFSENQGTTYSTGDYITLSYSIKPICSGEYVEPEWMHYILLNKDDSSSVNPIRVHKFNISGIIQASEKIVCY